MASLQMTNIEHRTSNVGHRMESVQGSKFNVGRSMFAVSIRRIRKRLALAGKVRRSRREALSLNARIALFHDFAPPPTGGGHQFLRALVAEWEREGIEVAVNCLPDSAEAVLINSFNFTPELLRRLLDRKIRVVHRVDGPLQVYRGFDDGTDQHIAELNREFADATVFQSEFSRSENERIGFDLARGPIIRNASDPTIFRRNEFEQIGPQTPLRVVAASWSDNPNKGLDVFKWIDANLDPSRFAFTFIGRAQMNFQNCRHVPAIPSSELAEELRQHDVFLTASLNDPCSNSVLEALTVGLPCVYRSSGGHPELVGAAGVGFNHPEEIPSAMERIRSDLTEFRENIQVPSIESVAEEYLKVLCVHP